MEYYTVPVPRYSSAMDSITVLYMYYNISTRGRNYMYSPQWKVPFTIVISYHLQ
jgi:hypothetical protein